MTSMRIDELISNLAIGIAQGQSALDDECMQIAQFMSEAKVAFGDKPGRPGVKDEVSLIELGFTPNFYQFVDTLLEVRISISSHYEETREYETKRTDALTDQLKQSAKRETASRQRVTGTELAFGGSSLDLSKYRQQRASESASTSDRTRKQLSMRTVDARYASTYNYAVEGSSSIKTKIVQVPVPEVFEDRVRQLVNLKRQQEEFYLALFEARKKLALLIAKAKAIGEHPLLPVVVSTEAHRNSIAYIDVTELQSSVVELATGTDMYDSLVADHWAVIAEPELHQAADVGITEAMTATDELVNAFDNGTLRPPEKVSNESLTASIGRAKTGLSDFESTVTTILAELDDKHPPETDGETTEG